MLVWSVGLLSRQIPAFYFSALRCIFYGCVAFFIISIIFWVFVVGGYYIIMYGKRNL
jgi:hypothetical protein